MLQLESGARGPDILGTLMLLAAIMIKSVPTGSTRPSYKRTWHNTSLVSWLLIQPSHPGMLCRHECARKISNELVKYLVRHWVMPTTNVSGLLNTPNATLLVFADQNPLPHKMPRLISYQLQQTLVVAVPYLEIGHSTKPIPVRRTL